MKTNPIEELLKVSKKYNLINLIQEVTKQVQYRDSSNILDLKSALEIKHLLECLEKCTLDSLESVVVTASGEKRFVNPKEKVFSLEELQKIVGGYIEIISLPNLKKKIVLNEEGKINNLPINHFATTLFRDAYKTNDYIVGTVLICDNNLL